MNPTGVAFVGYVLWMIVLLGGIAVLRTQLSFRGKRAPSSFSPSGDDVSPFSGRLCRAHANCYEAFPLVGGLLLLALATDATAITDPLALVVLGARLVQSLVHLYSIRSRFVIVRFAFFAVQYVICIYWAIMFLQRFL